MKLFYPPKFKKELRGFPKEIRQKFYKQAGFLLKNINHPSLRSKKYNQTADIWQVRVNKRIRFYFIIQKDVYIFIHIKKHSD